VSDRAFDPYEVFRTLTAHEVRFVVIGGLGARLHGSPVITNDTDICHERSGDNLERLATALRELGARLRGVDEDVPFQLDAETIRTGDHFTFTTSAGSVDCLGTPAGVDGFDELARSAVPFDVDGFSVLVASLEDLIRMKRAAGRPKDLIAAEWLSAVRDELER
jgi:hypothetical protein